MPQHASFGMSGLPVLMHTSYSWPCEPVIEIPEQVAVEFRDNPGIFIVPEGIRSAREDGCADVSAVMFIHRMPDLRDDAL